MAGNRPGPDKQNTGGNPGTPLSYCPPPPDHLSGPARDVWAEVGNDLVERGLLFAADLDLLESYCNWVVVQKDAAADIERNGIMLKNKNGDKQRNPALLTMSKATETVIKLAKALGLSPYARERSRGLSKTEEFVDPLDGLLS